MQLMKLIKFDLAAILFLTMIAITAAGLRLILHVIVHDTVAIVRKHERKYDSLKLSVSPIG